MTPTPLQQRPGFTLLVNPASGGGAAPASVVPVARLLRDAGRRVEVTYSPGPAACRALVDAAVDRGDVVVAVGGDGMVASLAGAVVDAGGTLGVVPSRRGNDFARQLRITREPQAVAAVLLGAAARDVDVIDVDGRVMVGSVYAGVDAVASAHADRAHRLPQSVQYPYAAIRALLELRPTTYDLTVDGTRRILHACTVVVANSGYYGAGMHIAPGAVLDDGLLDVVMVGVASRRRLIRALPRLYGGSHVGLEEVTMWRGREVTVRAVGPVLAYGDGERLGPLPVTATVRPRALRVLAP